MLLALAGCPEDEAPTDGASGSLTLKDLRTATTCPVGVDASKLPEGLELSAAPPRANATEYGEAVQVTCQFPLVGAAPTEEVGVMLVAAPPATDIFSVESHSGGTWMNFIDNMTGVDEAPLEQSVAALSGEQVRQLQGTGGGLAGGGKPLAVRSVDVEEAGPALLLVYNYGGADLTGDELAAVASALG